MDDNLRHQRDTSLHQLEALIRRGHQIRNTKSVDATRAWQQDCAAAINQLSGGSKGHWLARAYSGAFLVRSGTGGVVLEADATEIVDRILGVLAQGAASLSRMDEVVAASASAKATADRSSGAAPRTRQFEFVHNAELRPVLEQAFADSRDALARGESGLALILTCGIIDAVLTDALEHATTKPEGRSRGEEGLAPANLGGEGHAHRSLDEGGPVRRSLGEGGSFITRIAAAERAGLIRGGCARLPPVARRYRDLTGEDGELRADAPVSDREARLAGQVLRVVMRDLDPGR
jgi:hypothetical protein